MTLLHTSKKTNSLGLISDAFHMFFDCSALLLGLVAAVVARWSPNDRYTYGYVRADTLAGFVNAIFLVFIAFFILSEAIEVIIISGLKFICSSSSRVSLVLEFKLKIETE